MVEVATAPSLSFTLGLETPANHPGIAGILGSLSLNDLTIENPALPVPAVLAAGGSVGISALRAALHQLQQDPGNHKQITLLIPTTDAEAVGAGLGIADEFAMAWDATALPSPDLIQFAEWLKEEGFNNQESFVGMYPYTPGLLDGTAAAHVHKLGEILGSFAEQTPAIQREVTIAGN